MKEGVPLTGLPDDFAGGTLRAVGPNYSFDAGYSPIITAPGGAISGWKGTGFMRSFDSGTCKTFQKYMVEDLNVEDARDWHEDGVCAYFNREDEDGQTFLALFSFQTATQPAS